MFQAWKPAPKVKIHERTQRREYTNEPKEIRTFSKIEIHTVRVRRLPQATSEVWWANEPGKLSQMWSCRNTQCQQKSNRSPLCVLRQLHIWDNFPGSSVHQTSDVAWGSLYVYLGLQAVQQPDSGQRAPVFTSPGDGGPQCGLHRRDRHVTPRQLPSAECKNHVPQHILPSLCHFYS